MHWLWSSVATEARRLLRLLQLRLGSLPTQTSEPSCFVEGVAAEAGIARDSMRVSVVLVRDVGMCMPKRLVSMRMTVHPDGHRIVDVVMVAVVVHVRVLVHHRFVRVLVGMCLSEVEDEPCKHERRPAEQPGAAASLPQCIGQ
jgi:hypothetical protein